MLSDPWVKKWEALCLRRGTAWRPSTKEDPKRRLRFYPAEDAWPQAFHRDGRPVRVTEPATLIPKPPDDCRCAGQTLRYKCPVHPAYTQELHDEANP